MEGEVGAGEIDVSVSKRRVLQEKMKSCLRPSLQKVRRLKTMTHLVRRHLQSVPKVSATASISSAPAKSLPDISRAIHRGILLVLL